MEGLVCGAGLLLSELTKCVVHRTCHPIEAQRHERVVVEIKQLLCPLLRHAHVGLEDLSVRTLQVEERFDLDIRASRRVGHRHADRSVGTIFSEQQASNVVPLDVEPHAAPFRVA